MKLQFQKRDLIAVASVALLAVLVFVLFLPEENESAAVAEIYQNGVLVKTVSLTVDQEFTVTGAYSNTVAVRGGKIAVIQSDCPGEDCVHCGWVEGSGRSIVCLPNSLEVRVVEGHSDVDIVVG